MERQDFWTDYRTAIWRHRDHAVAARRSGFLYQAALHERAADLIRAELCAHEPGTPTRGPVRTEPTPMHPRRMPVVPGWVVIYSARPGS